MSERLSFTIRKMELTDLDQVIKLDQSSFTLPWPESSFRFEIEKNDASRCWVVELSNDQGQNKIIGMIVVWLIVDEVHIATIAIHPDYRQQGIARQLLAFTLKDACQSGAQKAFLEVRRGNLAAQALYSKFAFVEIGVRKKYYQDNHEDAIMMNLEQLKLDDLDMLL